MAGEGDPLPALPPDQNQLQDSQEDQGRRQCRPRRRGQSQTGFRVKACAVLDQPQAEEDSSSPPEAG